MESSSTTEASKAELALQRAEFFAEDELIEINPMVRSGVISLIRGDFGPFEPSITTTVSAQSFPWEARSTSEFTNWWKAY